MSYATKDIRNICLLGHGGSGKTQLVSALLFSAGMVNRLGLVDDGTTVTDYDDEEIARRHTLTATLAEVLRTLGSRAAYVVHGADGLDELSTTGVNRISVRRAGEVTTFDFDPAGIGLHCHEQQDTSPEDALPSHVRCSPSSAERGRPGREQWRPRDTTVALLAGREVDGPRLAVVLAAELGEQARAVR